MEKFTEVLKKSLHSKDQFEPQKFAETKNEELLQFKNDETLYCDNFYFLLLRTLCSPRYYSIFDYNVIIDLFCDLPEEKQYELAIRGTSGYPLLHEVIEQSFTFPLAWRNFTNLWKRLNKFKSLKQKHISASILISFFAFSGFASTFLRSNRHDG